MLKLITLSHLFLAIMFARLAAHMTYLKWSECHPPGGALTACIGLHRLYRNLRGIQYPAHPRKQQSHAPVRCTVHTSNIQNIEVRYS